MANRSEAPIDELIGAIYDCALEPRAWGDFLARLSRHLGGQAASLFAQDLWSSQVGFLVQHGFDPAFEASYMQHYATTNIWQPLMASLQPGSIGTDEQVSTLAELHRTEWYADWLRPQGLAHAVGGVVLNDSRGSMQLTVLRPERHGHFHAEEQALLQRLLPHMQRAMAVHRRLATVAVTQDALLTGYEGLGLCVFVVDAEARVLHANRHAEDRLRAADALVAPHGRLAASAAPATLRLHHAVRLACGGDGPARGSFVDLPQPEAAPLGVLVHPLAPGRRPNAGQPAALVLLPARGTDAEVNQQALAHRYRLTAAETRLLVALLRGEDLAGYARQSGITPQTARTHLKRIFGKTGHGRQVDLLRTLASDPLLRFRLK